jgi:hypothetical protein
MVSGPRGTSNSNSRGSATQRRKRKQALLERDGDGSTASCWECLTVVTYTTMICDRIIPGIRGGKYTLDNLRIHCASCSGLQAGALSAETRRRKGLRKRGLRRTRVSPAGERTPGRWWIVLDERPIGYVEPVGRGWAVGYAWTGVVKPRADVAESRELAVAALANAYDGRPKLIRTT